MNWKWWERREPPVAVRPLDSRTLVGVPDVFTGQDTTYGMAREMAEDLRDRNWQTATEKGLAITLLAVMADLEQVLYPADPADPEGDGAD